MASKLIQHLLSVVGAVVTVAGLLSILTSTSLKSWVKVHSYLVFVCLVFSIAAAFVVIDFAISRKRREGSVHDRRTVAQLLNAIPPNGSTIVWLKELFISKSIPIKHLDVLYDVFTEMQRNIVGLDNSKANRVYGNLRDAIVEFHSLAAFNLFSNEQYTVLERSPQWPWEQWQEASQEINNAHTTLIKAYDEFVRVCHKERLTDGDWGNAAQKLESAP